MPKYHDKVKLAIDSMDALVRLINTTGADRRIKALADNWIAHTRKPFSEEDYYKMVEKMTAHLRRKQKPNIPEECQ